MIKVMKLPEGAQMMIGKPANPFPKTVSGALADLMLVIPDVEEAHLPLLFIPGVMEKPSQVLAVVLRSGSDLRTVCERLERDLPLALPKGMDLDIWPVKDRGALMDIRAAGCCIAAKS